MGIKGYKAFEEKPKANQYTKEAFYEDYFEQRADDEKEAIMRHCVTGEVWERANFVKVANPHVYYTLRDVVIKLSRTNPSRFGNHGINIHVFKYLMRVINNMSSSQRQKEWINKYARKVL
jgi:DNA-binding TFAR19-related protein (PDSD5 family)